LVAKTNTDGTPQQPIANANPSSSDSSVVLNDIDNRNKKNAKKNAGKKGDKDDTQTRLNRLTTTERATNGDGSTPLPLTQEQLDGSFEAQH